MLCISFNLLAAHIAHNRNTVAGTFLFWDQVVLTFPVLGEMDYAHRLPCHSDFRFHLITDENPEEITWSVENDKGAIVASGTCT